MSVPATLCCASCSLRCLLGRCFFHGFSVPLLPPWCQEPSQPGTRVLQERWVRLTGSLHFPHRRLILAISSEDKALPVYRAPSSKGISHLALSLRGLRIRH